MHPEITSTRDDADRARATRSHGTKEAEPADPSDQLHAAILDAMSRKCLARQTALRKLLAPGEFDTLREAVARFVLVSKAEQASPERALIQLKNRLAMSARSLGREPQEVVSAAVLDAFLCSYYDEAKP